MKVCLRYSCLRSRVLGGVDILDWRILGVAILGIKQDMSDSYEEADMKYNINMKPTETLPFLESIFCCPHGMSSP
jgi:hypothetical protein